MQVLLALPPQDLAFHPVQQQVLLLVVQFGEQLPRTLSAHLLRGAHHLLHLLSELFVQIAQFSLQVVQTLVLYHSEVVVVSSFFLDRFHHVRLQPHVVVGQTRNHFVVYYLLRLTVWLEQQLSVYLVQLHVLFNYQIHVRNVFASLLVLLLLSCWLSLHFRQFV